MNRIRSVLVVVNPSAGQVWKPHPLPYVANQLTRLGFACQVRTVHEFRPRDLEAVCRIVVIGGDGTMHHLLPSLQATELPLGLIPWGTGNVLARELQLPRDVDAAVRVAAGDSVQKLQLGLAGQTPFLLMAGVGIDGYLVTRVGPRIKRLLGIGAFWLAGLRDFWGYPLPSFTVRLGDESLEATQALVSNCRSYGGGLQFTPDAEITQPGFSVCLFQGKRHWDYVRYLLRAYQGTHRKLADVLSRRAALVEITGSSGCLLQLDGEPAGTLPVRISSPGVTLNVLAPPPV